MYLTHEAIGYLKSRTIVIPNGYNTDVFKPDPSAKKRLRQELKIADDTKIIGVVGRWDWTKDHTNFLSALALVNGVHGVLVGSDIDSENKELMQAIQKNGISDRVHLLGYRDDVPSIIPGFDLLCLSSRAEALPNVIGEAMACGVPCVTTNVGDVAELVGDTGWVCEPQNHVMLAENIKLGFASDLDAHSIAARKRVEDNYSYAEMINAYKNLYDVKD